MVSVFEGQLTRNWCYPSEPIDDVINDGSQEYKKRYVTYLQCSLFILCYWFPTSSYLIDLLHW